MTILLTGGAGYIGSHTALELLADGHDIIIADNFSNSCEEVVKRIERIAGRKVALNIIDVTNHAALRKIFETNQIDAVIHFAGFKAVGESVRYPLRYYRNNLDCTISLLEVMKEFGVFRLIFSSSATVYGATGKLTEDMPVGPCTNPYGWTKLMSEQIISDECAANPYFSSVIIRYFNPVGAHASGLIGELPDGTPNNLMPYISQVAAGKLDVLSVFGNDYPTPDGTGIRDYIHVIDLAKGHVAALNYCLSHAGNEVFNFGTGVGYSVLDIVKAFEQVNGVSVPYRISERREGDIAEYYADPSKAENVLKWKAGLGLDDMCRDEWRWLQLNPNGYEH